ncbi:integrase [Oxalobacteraceae bacterium GrIS 1.11]
MSTSLISVMKLSHNSLTQGGARECRLLLLDGHDPLEARQAAQIATTMERAKLVTFDQCAKAYIDAHRNSWKNAKHAAQWENTLASYVSPVIGALPVAAVDTGLVVKVLAAIWQTKAETATRVRGRIESILDWATVSNFRQGDNPARWNGHLENLLANPRKIASHINHPALPWRELGEFMKALVLKEGNAARAVQFAILTAARSGEVRGARWCEIDLDEKLWTIPAERMKVGKEHRIPLSSDVLVVLNALPRDGDLLFPGRKRGAQLSDMSLTAVLRRMSRSDITIHGFRSTFRDWCSESVTNCCGQVISDTKIGSIFAIFRS